MSATCRADTSMLANFPNIPFFCRHPFLPVWPFPQVLMLRNANISMGTKKYKTIYNTQNRASKKPLWFVVIFWPHHAYYYLVGKGEGEGVDIDQDLSRKRVGPLALARLS
jgi:hypothetical protein